MYRAPALTFGAFSASNLAKHPAGGVTSIRQGRRGVRWITVGVACISLAACSKAPDGTVGVKDAAGNTVTAATGVAFTYAYGFRLPSARIADAQEAHARACEQLGAGRCRITGMTYRVDDAGTVSASLDVKLAADIARRFGRTATQTVERAGGALTGADIGGTDAQPTTAAAQADAEAGAADRTRVEHALARADLSARERATLRDQSAQAEQRRRAAVAALADARASVSTTPMSFTYHAGTGVGLSARLADAGQTAIGSLGMTIGLVLTGVAALGPPAILLLALLLFWRRLGRYWWQRLLEPAGRE